MERLVIILAILVISLLLVIGCLIGIYFFVNPLM